jgi:hypothetical protein
VRRPGRPEREPEPARRAAALACGRQLWSESGRQLWSETGGASASMPSALNRVARSFTHSGGVRSSGSGMPASLRQARRRARCAGARPWADHASITAGPPGPGDFSSPHGQKLFLQSLTLRCVGDRHHGVREGKGCHHRVSRPRCHRTSSAPPPKQRTERSFGRATQGGHQQARPIPIGGYLEPSRCMPHLTRMSAAWTCSRPAFTQWSLNSKGSNEKGFTRGLWRRQC